MTETVEQILDGLTKLVHKAYLEKKVETLPPTFYLTFPKPTQKAALIPTPWANDEEKKRMVHDVWLFMQIMGVEAYGFMSECWKAYTDGEDLANGSFQRPSDRIDKTEVVMAFAVTEKKTLYRTWLMIRDWKGDVVELREDEMPQETEPVSWLAELLKKK